LGKLPSALCPCVCHTQDSVFVTLAPYVQAAKCAARFTIRRFDVNARLCSVPSTPQSNACGGDLPPPLPLMQGKGCNFSLAKFCRVIRICPNFSSTRKMLLGCHQPCCCCWWQLTPQSLGYPGRCMLMNCHPTTCCVVWRHTPQVNDTTQKSSPYETPQKSERL
jgi:hypothetical protein